MNRERNKLKQFIRQQLGIDLSRLLNNYDRQLATLISQSNSATITTSDFSTIINNIVNDLQKSGNSNLSSGRSDFVNLNDQIKAALDFNYPIDYSLLPRVNVDDQQLRREFGSVLSNYREGNINEYEMRRELRGRMHQPANIVNTYVNTQLAGFDNSSQKTIGDLAGLDSYVYIGPLNNNTRPFCRRLLENKQLFTENQVKAMDNEQGIPVIRYCGGYNCLHEWMRVAKEWAEVKDYLMAA